ncbi:MAG: hypothetical protein IAF02_14295 [Anaerolineae bacterium]|nr:hypothetical protein [Anaerolineae bacterium]
MTNFIQEARNLIELGTGREGPESNEHATQLGIAYCLLSIAKSLDSMAQLAESEAARADMQDTIRLWGGGDGNA